MTLQLEEVPEKLVVQELKKLPHPQPRKGGLTAPQGATLPLYHHPLLLQPSNSQMGSSPCSPVHHSLEPGVGTLSV